MTELQRSDVIFGVLSICITGIESVEWVDLDLHPFFFLSLFSFHVLCDKFMEIFVNLEIMSLVTCWFHHKP